MDEEEEEEEEGVPIINTLYSSKRTHSDIREHLLQWLLKEFDQSCAENSMCAFVACACACVQDEVVRHPAQGARPQQSKAVVVHGRVGAGIKGVQPPLCVTRVRGISAAAHAEDQQIAGVFNRVSLTLASHIGSTLADKAPHRRAHDVVARRQGAARAQGAGR